ncbi:uncharacterized protein N7483_006371 [Penicillium malachiteum]|uniref:uncharacterized protein n=1 Tax=Penicillium malachiteum TaxID=1324776 RepID=UPI0025477CC9|nr:uncharacterized protein N7483_006371 [Penicillium malachiteum]KAJ5725014.1 hypothetical protein N7483_006371 [Penicillium malachiteum]
MRNHMALGWFYSPSQIAHYFATRITSLKPPRGKLKNPYTTIKQLDRHQWLMFAGGFTAWTWDAFDYFTVSITMTAIAEDFNVSYNSVSWGMTITLMLRSVGALIFGFFSDRYGRKWPMIIDLIFFIILEVASGFCQTLPQFLGVRALYGIAMGGLYGPAGATALEDLPYDARGILSGLYQEGYAVGYFLAAAFYRALAISTSHGWRTLFWFGAGPPVLIILFRLWLPETNHFQVMKAEREARERAMIESGQEISKFNRTFLSEVGQAIRPYWLLLVYIAVVMAGFNGVSHGSEDLYPTFLEDQVGMSATNETVVTIVGQVGALLGAMLFGYLSAFFGRRLTMLVACISGAAIIPAYLFLEQFFVGAVWGPIPIHLMELSPTPIRSLMLGLGYQLGNLASSASATIETTIGSRYPLPPLASGTARYNYGKVIAIFLGAVWAYIFFFLLLGPEMSQEGRDTEKDEALQLEQLILQGISPSEIAANREFMAKSKPFDEEDPQVVKETHDKHIVEHIE